MLLEELQKKINDLNVPVSLYSIGNDLKPNAHILYKNYNNWEYFFLDEKGGRNDIQVFNSSSSAYKYLFSKLEAEMRFPPSVAPLSVYGFKELSTDTLKKNEGNDNANSNEVDQE